MKKQFLFLLLVLPAFAICLQAQETGVRPLPIVSAMLLHTKDYDYQARGSRIPTFIYTGCLGIRPSLPKYMEEQMRLMQVRLDGVPIGFGSWDGWNSPYYPKEIVGYFSKSPDRNLYTRHWHVYETY